MVDFAERVSDLERGGFCILRGCFDQTLIQNCRQAFWPKLLEYLERNRDLSNRGPHRHFLPMPFDRPCFTPDFFFDRKILRIVGAALGEDIVADQWGCDVPLAGSIHQDFHVDYQRPLFPETPQLVLPTYMLVVSFGLMDISAAHGPIEILPGTHVLPRQEALQAATQQKIEPRQICLAPRDVLIRHPWALHRGTPNRTSTPRALLTIRYVRRWYADHSREANPIPAAVWRSLTVEQQRMLRFPLDPATFPVR